MELAQRNNPRECCCGVGEGVAVVMVVVDIVVVVVLLLLLLLLLLLVVVVVVVVVWWGGCSPSGLLSLQHEKPLSVASFVSARQRKRERERDTRARGFRLPYAWPAALRVRVCCILPCSERRRCHMFV